MDYIIPSVIGIVVALVFWRAGLWRKLVSWSPWPAKLEVNKDVTYLDQLLGQPNVHWYEGSVEIAIIPWITINIHDFYVQLEIDGEQDRITLSTSIEDVHSNSIKVAIGKGYRLEPSKPIGPKQFTFNLMTQKGQTVPTIGLVVLEAGIRRGKFAIRKYITLRPS